MTKEYKPMIRPMPDQPVDIDLFGNIYESINSLGGSDISYVVDNWSAPWGNQAADVNANSGSGTGFQLKVATGIFAINDGGGEKMRGTRTWEVQFPAGVGFTSTPIVVCTPVHAGAGPDPVATCIQWQSAEGFRVLVQSVDSTKVGISHINYIAIGF